MTELRIGCLVMAAGSGSRFGRNKLEAVIDGKTLLRRALEAVPREEFACVTVVTQYDGAAALAEEFGFAVVRNDRPEDGLSRTVRLGTEAMAGCDAIMYQVADQPLLELFFGMMLPAVGAAILFNINASTGGTDFIALYVSNKTGKSIWSYVFVFNACILCIFGYLFGWLYAGYSILFQFISTKTVETFHHRYERLTLQITTQKAEEIMAAYVSGCRHGMSCVKAVGGYSHKDMSVLHTVISSYEESDIVHLILQVDPHAIINVLRTENFYGGFYRAPLD